MERKALRETLARLHAELETAEPIDAELRAELEQALAEIRERIERERHPGDEPLAERLEALAVRFEQSHPVITRALGGVIRALGAMGI
jgi:hypothetical protein